MISTICQFNRTTLLLCALLILWFAPTQPAEAARPASSKLFPKETLVYLSVPNVQGLAEKFQETALGLMAQDPQMKPLVEKVYAALLESSRPLEENLGVSLPELLAVPNGELAVGLVLPPESRPALLALLDTGENVAAVKTLLERADRALLDAGADKQSEQAEGIEVTVYNIPGRRQRQVVYVQKEGTLIASTNALCVRALLSQWQDTSLTSLADNPQFAGVKRNISGGAEEPQLIWFVDPVNLIREVGRGNTNATIASALFPALGLDGLQGVGGSVAFAEGQFDNINRLHILLSPPRTGVIELLALKTGDVTPEAWVPAQSATYTTLHWDVEKTYKKLQVLIDSFQGEGAFKSRVQSRLPPGANVDVATEIIPLLEGRITYITFIEEPITPRSQSPLLGIKLVDSQQAQGIFNRLADAYAHVVERKNYLGKAYVKYRPADGGGEEEDGRFQPRPCFALLDDYLLVGRESLLEKAILATSDPSKSLGQSLDFKLIASKAQRQSGGSRPSMFSFQRPEEGLRFLYGLATSDNTRQGLQRRAENNQFIKGLSQALNDHPLPPLATLQKYVAPGGAVMIDDESGIRYTSFTLRRSEE